MTEFIWETPEELNLKLAKRVRNIRKRRSISQQKLSEMSGVSYGSIKRFESTGQISLLALTRQPQHWILLMNSETFLHRFLIKIFQK